MIDKNKKVGVLYGGLSKEREISLKTGRAIAEALKRKSYEVVEIDVGWDIAKVLTEQKIDVAFIALHGRYGEDGCVQGLLEILKIPYTGSGVMASALAMDKDMTKRIVSAEGIRVPNGKLLEKKEALSFSLPVIIKPNREGSTIGMSIVREESEWDKALDQAFQCDPQVLVEEFVKGTEVTVAVLNGTALTPLEVVPKSGFYDFQSKYTKGMTEYILPARISPEMTETVQRTAEKVYRLLKLSGVSRMDFIIRKIDSGEESAFFLEANTIPGMTETSLVPKMAAHSRILFEDLCEMILTTASLKT